MSNENIHTRVFLGLVAEHQRVIRDGLEYDKYFPKAEMKGTILIEDGNVKQTVQLMRDFVIKFKGDTEKIAKILKGDDLEETCKNIWTFLYNHIQYKLDKDGVEQLRRPARSWADRKSGIDCDCFSIFAGTILYNLGIPFRFRVTKYGAGWQHVYIVVPDGKSHQTIDCVIDGFNEEKPYSDKFDTKMDRNTHLSGIPIEFLSGLENLTSEFNHGTEQLLGCPLCGLGAEPTEAERLAKLKEYLVKSRDYILENPNSVIMSGGAKNNLKMLNYAIEHWDTPQRDAALDALEKAEQDNSDSSSEDDSVDGIGKIKDSKFFGKIKEAVEKVKENHPKLAEVGKDLVKFNPVTLAVRGGFLLGMKINAFQLAKHLYPAYMTEAEAAKQGISSAQWNAAKRAKDQIEKMFTDKLKGESKTMKDAITEGRASKKFDELNGVDGLGELGSVALLATLTSAAVPLAAAGSALDKAGVSAADKKKFGDKVGAFFKKSATGIKAAIAKKKAGATDKAASTDPSASTDVTDPSTSTPDASKETPPSFMQKIGTFVSENKVATAIGGLVLISGVALAVSPKLRAKVGFGKKKGVSGLGRVKVYRTGKHLTKKKGKMLRKGSHVKAITLK